ncbi:hypothetical protein Hanom_Chr06g00521381 [Helianthus anomalus]
MGKPKAPLSPHSSIHLQEKENDVHGDQDFHARALNEERDGGDTIVVDHNGDYSPDRGFGGPNGSGETYVGCGGTQASPRPNYITTRLTRKAKKKKTYFSPGIEDSRSKQGCGPNEF